MVEEQFDRRWEEYLRPASLTNAGEVMTGLLKRQVELTVCFARSPIMWEVAVAPVMLRTMIETYLNLAWILRDPVQRAEDFIDYGLGQAKLILEHRRAELTRQGIDPDADQVMKVGTAWLESQRFSFLTTVNVGHWADKDLRQMADEIGEGGLYRLAYVPFSAAVHSQWYHIARANLVICENPLHGFHRVPGSAERPWITHLAIAAKYLTRTFNAIDAQMDYQSDDVSPLDWLNTVLRSAGEALDDPEMQVEEVDTLDDGVGV